MLNFLMAALVQSKLRQNNWLEAWVSSMIIKEVFNSDSESSRLR
jgi:hypothetical protein